jgi:hypothetical protein
MNLNVFEFWVEEEWISEYTWASVVTTKGEVHVRLSPSYSEHWAAHSRPPPSPPLRPIPASVADPSAAPAIELSGLFRVESDGVYKITVSEGHDRFYSIWTYDTGLSELYRCQKLRENAPPERWADLTGGNARKGKSIGLDNPEAAIGSLLKGSSEIIRQVKDTVFSVVVVFKAKISKANWKDDGACLDGDYVYSWAPFASVERAQVGVKLALGEGYGIEASWLELRKDDLTCHNLIGLAILEKDTAGRECFGVVGMKPQ